MRGLFDRFRRRRSNPDVEAQARAQFECGLALHQDFMQAPAAHKIPRLLEAIQCFKDVLSIFTEQDFPVAWAATQANLGSAYAKLPIGDRGANLEAAISYYQAALRVYTERSFPEAWAIIQDSLGGIYPNLPMGNRGAKLGTAIACCQAALRVYTEQGFPVGWARTQYNL